jgi:hypothetical protein
VRILHLPLVPICQQPQPPAPLYLEQPTRFHHQQYINMAYQATAEIPHIGDLRKRLLRVYDTGSRVDLLLEAYAIAEEWHYASTRPAGFIAKKRSMKASMESMLDDWDECEYIMLRILLCIPWPLIGSLILGDIGSKYVTDPIFRSLFYKTDNTIGVYVNTIMVKNRGGGSLTAAEWMQVRKMIADYMRDVNVPTTALSPQPLRARAEASKQIDDAYGSRNTADFDTLKGDRYFYNRNGGTRAFWESLQARVRPDLDPTNAIPQKQSPCEVGLSSDLKKRMANHSTSSKLTMSPGPWGLVLSCLKVKGIDAEVISLPIIKAWESNMATMGEILITLLSGSMVEDGGYNPSQPGVNKCKEPEDWTKTGYEVFADNDWLDENLKAAESELTERKNALHASIQFDKKNFDREVSDLRENLDDFKRAREALHIQLDAALKEIPANLEKLNKHLEEVTSLTTSLNESAQMRSAIDTWLDEDD